jgi:hypothetical protein
LTFNHGKYNHLTQDIDPRAAIAEALLLEIALRTSLEIGIRAVTVESLSQATTFALESIAVCLGSDAEIQTKVLALALKKGYEIRILAPRGMAPATSRVPRPSGVETPKRRRLAPENRREQIILAAMEVAREVGYQQVTRNLIAERAGISDGLVTIRLGTTDEVSKLIMSEAIVRRDLIIIAQGLATNDAIAISAPASLREESRQALGNNVPPQSAA